MMMGGNSGRRVRVTASEWRLIAAENVKRHDRLVLALGMALGHSDGAVLMQAEAFRLFDELSTLDKHLTLAGVKNPPRVIELEPDGKPKPPGNIAISRGWG